MKPSESRPSFACPECGPRVPVDEDGCCRMCGADTTVTREAPAASAPADEPVRDGCINCGEANDGGYMSGFEGHVDEGAVGPFCSQCWAFMQETFEAPLKAENERLTAERDEARAHGLELAARLAFVCGQDIGNTERAARAALIQRAEQAEAALTTLRTKLEGLEQAWRDNGQPYTFNGDTYADGLLDGRYECADEIAAVLKKFK